MADTKISALTALTGAGVAADDALAIVDTSTTTTKKIDASELKTYVNTPSGSDTQVQFNDGGAFGGDSGLTFDKTNNALTVGGATVTTSNPVLNLTQTWNAAVTFTGIKLDVTSTSSNAASLLLDLQVGSASQFSVKKNGDLTWDASVGSIKFNSPSGYFDFGAQGQTASVTIGGFGMSPGAAYTLGTASVGFTLLSLAATGPSTGITLIYSDAANTLAVKNSTNAQELRVYKTTTGPVYKALVGDQSLIKISGAAFTDGAAASTGTLTNAPAAGNPTKWIPIDDNGTTRYIPAW